jgi:CRISPR-associated protein (TIGR03984 family)
MAEPQSNTEQLRPLSQCVTDFAASVSPLPKTFAVLYAPDKCYLALVDSSGKFEVKDNVSSFDVNKVFEARVFNAERELRWLKGYGTVVISDASFTGSDFVGKLDQKYLMWGQGADKSHNGWTRFATARIGAFHVPVELKSNETYARFTAVEYLKGYKDGNVAVVDERLTGIEGYGGESHNA